MAYKFPFWDIVIPSENPESSRSLWIDMGDSAKVAVEKQVKKSGIPIVYGTAEPKQINKMKKKGTKKKPC